MIKRNIVNTNEINEALILLLIDKSHIITVDANFFIPPDRSREAKNIPPFSFDKFKEIWILPLIQAFKNITIHEAVYDELLGNSLTFIDSVLEKPDKNIELLLDSNLSSTEKAIRNSIEMKIAPNTSYIPSLDNKDDRGEVKSLAYIATVGLPYFCSHDNNAIRLIDLADELDTGLQGVNAIRTYEILYLLSKSIDSSSAGLRAIYKYLYYLTKKDKSINPSWGEFIQKMELLYDKE